MTKTIEEKAKVYDGLIERLKDLKFAYRFSPLSDTIEDIFPELAESEDERIRKELIEFVKSRGGFKQEYIAWLEKQGESIKIKKGKNYLCTKTHKYAGVEWKEGIKYYSPEDYSLVNQGCTCYCPKYSKEEHNNFFKEVEYDGCLEKQGEEKPTVETKLKIKEGKWYICISQFCNCIEGRAYKATSDSRIMDDFGTEYDMHSDAYKYFRLWTIQDAKDGDVLATQDSIFIFKHIDKTGRSLCKSYCEVIGNSGLGLGFEFSINGVHPATKEQRDILFQKMKEAGYEWDAEKKELKKIEQNPAEWGEEDEKMFLDIESLIHSYRTGNYEHELSSWFESIKGRIVPQPKYKWSEKDNIMIENIINMLEENIEEYGITEHKGYSEIDILDWINNRLKPLRTQSHWKPTEEQMIVIERCLFFLKNNHDEDSETMSELLNQLKTL